VNPVIALLGYRFYLGKASDESRILVLSKEPLGSGTATIVELSSSVWIHVSSSN